MISSGDHYTDQVFRGELLDEVEIRNSEFYECQFFQCSFVESSLVECKFTNCTFDRCDLSLFQVAKSRFSGVRFQDSKVVGVNWAQAYWPEIGIGEPLEFHKCVLSHATFIELKLRGIQIIDCIAIDVDFRQADLSTADFSGTDLSESMFGDTDLSGANMNKARNYQIDASQNVIKGARFSLPEAMSLLYSLDIILDGEEDIFSNT